MKLFMENFKAYQLTKPELVFGGKFRETWYCTNSTCGEDVYDTETETVAYFPF